MQWKHLKRRPGSKYRQLFIAGTRIMASSLVGTMRAENMSVEEAASDFHVSISAVREAIRYCHLHKRLIDAETEEVRLLFS